MSEQSLLHQIPIDSFAKLVKLGAVYVDKTGLILELVKSYGPFFLSRPRRFGKSLLLDTIRQIFEGRKELFSGLEIEKRDPNFSWEKFPVIRINMNTVNTDPEQFQNGLIGRLLPISKSHHVEISQSNIASAISDLITNISLKYAIPEISPDSEKGDSDGPGGIGIGNVVLLIDEYDFPLLQHLRNPEKIEKLRLMLYEFYSAIKGCSDYLRFVFITGITKFKQLSIFSALNNVVDLSYESDFATICGFTKCEISSFFGKHLEKALSKQIAMGDLPPNSTPDNLIDKIADWYDGYSWDGETRVFNPFSIKSFLHQKKFGNYWYESGRSLLADVIDSFDGNRFSIFGKNISLEAPLEIQDTTNINDEAFLFQAGYLTIDAIDSIGGSDIFHLTIPNKEIKNAINKELTSKFKQFMINLQFMKTSKDTMMNFTNMKDKLLSSLWSGDINTSEMLLSSIFSGNPKEWYRGGGEGSYKLILLTLMRFGGAIFSENMLEVLGEVYSDAGRADLLFDVSGKGYVVIELKYIEDDGDRQAIQKSRYSRHSRRTVSPEAAGSDLTRAGEHPASLTGFTRLLEYGNKPDKVERILESKIEEAFNQILDHDYGKPYLVSGKTVRAAAIAVYGTSVVMVRFAEVVWKDIVEGMPELKRIPPPARFDLNPNT
ncbi:MAG: AAA family ATPase [Deltaproteobacteria bacterium]|jgi:hypothetical protein|nr:AAA family ATPase [Deltaproteobacteria bacterium]